MRSTPQNNPLAYLAEPARLIFNADYYTTRNPDVVEAGIDPFEHFLTSGIAEDRPASPLFDAGYYKTANPDVANAGMSAIEHYLTSGGKEIRNPHPLFNAEFYREQCPELDGTEQNLLIHYLQEGAKRDINPHPLFSTRYYSETYSDVIAAGKNPLVHFLETGWLEGRNPHPLFDTHYYLGQDPALAQQGINPLIHFVETGWQEERNPHPLFNTKKYLEQDPALAQQGINPLIHFIATGWLEARAPHSLFDVQYYLEQDPTIAQQGHNPLIHFLSTGWKEGKNPHPVFNCNWYLEAHPGFAELGINPLLHFVEKGWQEGHTPHPLFDTHYYLGQDPALAQQGINPLIHFVETGWQEERNPHPLFNTKKYLEQDPALAQQGINPLIHFIATGWLEARAPHSLFDVQYYLEQDPTIAQQGHNPLIHFLSTGWKEGKNPHPVFNCNWYLEAHPGFAELGINPLLHFVEKGWQEGHTPHPLFDTQYYLEQDPALAQQGINPLIHFLDIGWQEGKNPHPVFNSNWHLESYPDLAELGINPLIHFITSGGREGRQPHPLFDSRFYLLKYHDDIDPDENPLMHYIRNGMKKGYQPHPLFDPLYYHTQYIEETGSIENAFLYFLQAGFVSGHSPHMLFDPVYYVEQCEDPDVTEENAFQHYLSLGPNALTPPHILFDPYYYGEQGSDWYDTGQTPLSHYLTYTNIEETNPHRLFNTHYYLNRYFNINSNNENSLVHYLTRGESEAAQPNPYFLPDYYRSNAMTDESSFGENALIHFATAMEEAIENLLNTRPVDQTLRPNPWFDPAWYLVENPDVLEAGMNPLSHFITQGTLEGRRPGPNFNTVWYRETYQIAEDIDPLHHFLETGTRIGNQPNARAAEAIDKLTGDPELAISLDAYGRPTIDSRQYHIIAGSDLFDAEWYTKTYLTPNGIHMDPVEHYMIYGANIGYNPGPNFNSQSYRSINHDLRDAAINPLLHYVQHGRYEGRLISQSERTNAIEKFRFSPPEYGPITDILEMDSHIRPPSHMKNRICVHLHFYHTQMAEEFCDVLNRLEVPFTLLVSVQIDQDVEHWQRYFTDHVTHAETIIVRAFSNIGRDVFPWVSGFKNEIRGHEIFCHLHTKKSGYNKFQQSWRRYLLHTAFGAKTLVNQILGIFDGDEEVGLIYPAYFYILRNQPNYGKNYRQYERLYALLFGSMPDEDCPDYPAGSFFWARTAMLEPLFDLEFEEDSFDDETGQVDGTVAHAIERILGALPEHTGFTKRCIGIDIPFDLINYIHPARLKSLNTELIDTTRKKLSAYEAYSPAILKKRKLAVYTAITGGYENLVRPLLLETDVDYFVLTDEPNRYEVDWATVIECPYRAHRPVRTARYIKTHPHFWFPDHDYAIWLDANVLPSAPLSLLIERLDHSPYDAAFIEHPLRFNFMEEGNALIEANLDDKKLIEEQMLRYANTAELFAQNLIETNLFVCRPQMPVTRKMMSLWWQELNNYSHRDQLSINYAIYSSGLSWVSLFEENISLRDHPDFFLLEHELEKRDAFIAQLMPSQSRVEEFRKAS